MQALHRMRLENTLQQGKHRAFFNAKVGARYRSESEPGLGCSGFFTPSTSYKTNIVCTRHISGYTFSLQDTLCSELYPTVKEVANEVSQTKYYTAPWIALWYTGLICALLELLLLPWTWFGTRRLNGYGFLLALVSSLFLLSLWGVGGADENIGRLPNPANLLLSYHHSLAQRTSQCLQHHRPINVALTYTLSFTLCVAVLCVELERDGVYDRLFLVDAF